MRAPIRGAVWAAALLALVVRPARSEDAVSPPAPELPAPRATMPEPGVDALPPGDARRPELLLELALLRHREADALEQEERRVHAEAVALWRESLRGGGASLSSPFPPLATPHADAQRAEAVRLAQRALDENIDLAGAPQALLVAGVDAERIGRRKEAARALGALVRGFPASPHAAEAWLVLGEHHLALRDLTKARAAFESAARSESSRMRAWAAARLAEVAVAANDGEGALEALARALAAGSARGLAVLDDLAARPDALASDRDALGRLAGLCERSGDVSRALFLRERLGKDKARHGSPERARADARRAMPPAGPASPLAGGLRLRASALASESGPRLELRLAAYTGDPAALHALGLAALGEGRAGEARALFERALASRAMEREEAGLENDLAVALSALGDGASARAALARAADRDPGLGSAQENLGALSLSQLDPAGAEHALARAVALEPGRWQARLLHAQALAALGRSQEALTEAEGVLEAERGQRDALGLVAILRGNGGIAPARGRELLPPP